MYTAKLVSIGNYANIIVSYLNTPLALVGSFPVKPTTLMLKPGPECHHEFRKMDVNV